jgi:hypothetical protein
VDFAEEDAWPWLHARAVTALVTSDDRLEEGPDPAFLRLQVESGRQAHDLCEDEPFAEDPMVVDSASGFWVGGRLFVTVGHALYGDVSHDCTELRVVFGYDRVGRNRPPELVRTDDVYACHRVLARRETESVDWMLIELDREVGGRVPLPTGQAPEVGDKVAMLGHPLGAPLKVTEAEVRYVHGGGSFSLSSGALPGHSGSPVVNARGEIVGIHLASPGDLRYTGECNELKLGEPSCEGCATTATGWEQVAPYRRAYDSADVYGTPMLGVYSLEPGIRRFGMGLPDGRLAGLTVELALAGVRPSQLELRLRRGRCEALLVPRRRIGSEWLLHRTFDAFNRCPQGPLTLEATAWGTIGPDAHITRFRLTGLGAPSP